MTEVRGSYTSLFARPAATDRTGEAPPAEDHRGAVGGAARPEPVIDLRSLDAARPVRVRATPPPSRRSLWLAVRPVTSELTRPLPPGLFSLSAPARAAR